MVILFPLDKYPEVELLIIWYFYFEFFEKKKLHTVFHSSFIQLPSHQQETRFSFLYDLTSTCCLVFFIRAILPGEVIPHCSFICILLMIRSVEHLFRFLLYSFLPLFFVDLFISFHISLSI